MFSLLLSALGGTFVGIVTAFIPGMHVNTISLLIVGIAIEKNFSMLHSAVFLLTAAISHLFVEFIPSIFLNAVDTTTALVVQPAQRFVAEGRGYEALKLTAYGGMFGFLAAVLLLPVFFFAVPPIYAAVRPFIGFLLLATIGIMIFSEKKKRTAALVIILSGLFGLVSLQNTTINTNYLLFPILTGLFGISSLIYSMQTNAVIPPQKTDIPLEKATVLKGSLTGIFGGILAGFLPGIGSSQSLIFAQSITRLKGMHTFLVAMGAINIVDIVLSIMAILILGNPRSGVAVSLQSLIPDLDKGLLITLLFYGGLAAIIGLSATLFFGKNLVVHLPKLPHKALSVFVLIVLLTLISVFTGWVGLIYASAGSVIGLIPHYFDVKKSLLMGCLLLPTTLFFLNLTSFVLHMIGL